MPQVALVEVLVHRERRRQEVELLHPLAGRTDVGSDLVAVPELGLEVGDELVVDHELRLRQGCEPLEHLARLVRDLVRASLHGGEPDAVAGNVQHDHVREGADEHRVARLEHVLGDGVELVEGGGVRTARLAPERPGLVGIEHVEHEIGVRDVVHPREVVALELTPDRLDPCRELRRRGGSPNGVLPHGRSVSARPAGAGCGQRPAPRCVNGEARVPNCAVVLPTGRRSPRTDRSCSAPADCR